MKTRVVIFDDNAGRRQALQMLIDNTNDMVCAGAFENCVNVIENITTTKPDVVLMDIDMPEVDGIKGLQLIRQHTPNVLIIMQTVFEDEEKIFSAVRNGAHGYFLKKTRPQKLIEGIRDALEGGAPMTPIVAKKVLEMVNTYAPKPAEDFHLSERELEILSYLVKGMSYKMIADAAGISWHTVNSYFKKIYDKLHVHSATEAVARALKERIV